MGIRQVSWLDKDPENPQTYAQNYKWTVTMTVAISTLAVALASSALSGATSSIAEDFEESRTTVLALVTSIFVLGFAIGPLLWAPLSEIYGRRATLLVSYSFFTLWNAVVIASPNIASVLVFRFLAGAFGSSPLTCVDCPTSASPSYILTWTTPSLLPTEMLVGPSPMCFRRISEVLLWPSLPLLLSLCVAVRPSSHLPC